LLPSAACLGKLIIVPPKEAIQGSTISGLCPPKNLNLIFEGFLAGQ
jgi:hypothetical protein